MNEPGAQAQPPDEDVARVLALADAIGLGIRPDDVRPVAGILRGILEAGERLQRGLPTDVVPTDDPHWPDTLLGDDEPGGRD